MGRMKELIKLLNNASKSYYDEDRSIMSDFEYDKLYDELVELEKSEGLILSSSPTKSVGFEVLSSLVKVKHDSKILSLDKTKEISKLKLFLGNEDGLLSWKLDGLTIVLKYSNGKLIQAITRGNDEVGEDITHNAKVFSNIPLNIDYKGELILRGEGLITFTEFERINEALPDDLKYKNPRNLCSGTVRQLNSEIVAKRNVIFYAFTLVRADGTDFDKKSDQLEFLKELGFEIVENCLVDAKNIEDEVIRFQKEIILKDFATDGLVVTFNDIEYSASLGETSKFPRDSIAFKWMDELINTKLIDVIWNTSRTGLINPVAIFDTVEIEGSTVSRASLHNVSIMEELMLGVGDTIKVYKANMIIPQVAENITKSNNIIVPKYCSVCKGETEIRKLKEVKALYCTNATCEAQLVRRLVHFCSRDAMNIEGMSEETIKKFVTKKFLKNYTDLFIISNYEEEIKTMEGFRDKSYSNLIESIEKAKSVGLPNFIYALGINNIGLNNAKLLCRYFKYDLDKIIKSEEEELIAIDGFGEVIAHSLYSYFSKKENLLLLQKALEYIHLHEHTDELSDRGKIFKDKTFVITGDVSIFKNRKEVQEKIEELGGKVSGSVSQKTSFLINNDIYSDSSKNKKAKELGIPIITERMFVTELLKEEL